VGPGDHARVYTETALRPKSPADAMTAPPFLASLALLGRMILDRLSGDQVMRVAAALSYTSLLALVPLLAIALAIVTAFPVFADLRGAILDTLFQVFFPYADDIVRETVVEFVNAAGGLTALGVVGLAVTAVMLLVTIETAMNAIFRVRSQRSLLSRLLVYWAAVSLGPILLGASMSLSGYLFSLRDVASVAPAPLQGLGGALAQLVPWALAVLAFTLMFVVVPNRPVRPLDALAGGVVAAVLVAILRVGFLVYVTNADAYRTLYGALAVIPVFLVWMYLSWLVVLVGAVIAAVMPAWRMRRQDEGNPRRQDLIAAVRVLRLLQDAATVPPGRRTHAGVTRHGMLGQSDLPEERLRTILTDLAEAGLVTRTDEGRWTLARDLDAVTLDEVLGLLGLRLPDWEDTVRTALGDCLSRARDAERDVLAVPLKHLLLETDRNTDGKEPPPSG